LVVWDAANYPSWEYFYRIIAGILRRVRALVCSNEEDDFDRINRTNFNNSKQQHLLPFIYLIPFTRTHFSQPSSLPRLAALFVEKGLNLYQSGRRKY